MEESKSCEEEFKSDDFVDAYEEFPFFDCVSNAKWVKKGEESVEKGEECQLSELTSKQPPEPPLRSPRFRRRYPRARNSSIVSSTIEVCDGFTPRERTQIISDIHDHEPQQSGENSSITLENGDSRPVEVVEVEDSLVSSGFLVFVAGLVIKVVTFQISLVVSSFAVPVWLVYCSFMFITDPIQSLMRAKCRIVEKLIEVWGSFCESVAPFLSEQKSIGKLVVKFGWGFLWAVYVCFVLFGFLVTGFVLGGVVMRYIVEEPIQMSEMLNFDYTNTSPVALVPIMSCPNELCGLNCKEMVDSGKNVRSRVFLVNHKVQLTVSLTLPESEYNRKLGVFQVRADFLSETGQVTDSSRRPVMLHFKSHLIRYLETFLKSVPLLTGYSSESQVLKVEMRGFTKRYGPTSCIRVILEQRAEYRSGAGIPEIYGASLLIESELPLFKRIIWYWKKLIYLWVSTATFCTELVFALLCCRPIIIPRARPREGTANSTSSQNSVTPTVVRRC